MTSPQAEKPPRLRNNILALSVVQLSNYIIPLITLPYLTRVLGLEAYGKIAFAQVLMVYFILFTDYGFSWSATRKISTHRTDRAYISRVFVGTWAAQWLLILGAATLASILVWTSTRLRPDAWLYAAAFTAVLGNALFPIWFLQGLERLQVVASLQLVTRLLALIPIFLFVKQPADAVYVPAIQGGGVMLGGVLALGWIKQKNLVDWHWPHWRAVVQELGEGLPLFSTRLSISFYTTLIPLTLGWIAGPIALAHYNLADKIRTAVQSLLGPLSQALYPRMVSLFTTDKSAAVHLLRRSFFAVSMIAGSASIMLWLLADHLVVLLGGEEFLPAGSVLRWLAFCPLALALSNLFGVQTLIAMGKHKVINITALCVGIAATLLCSPAISSFQENGAAAVLLSAEIAVAIIYLLTSLRAIRR